MKSKKHAKRSKKAVKVVYISSPMKVKTSASEFRALVQELTGKDSDACRLMDVNGAQNSPEVLDRRPADDHNESTFPLMNSYHESSSTSSGSVFEPYDGLFPSMDGSFMGMFQSNFFHESSHQLDVFN